MSSNGVSQTLRMVATAAVTFIGGTFALGFLTSSISGRLALQKKKKYGRLCGACKGIGYYPCKLCKTNGTIEWSPLYDPVFINPCVCPTCDGFRQVVFISAIFLLLSIMFLFKVEVVVKLMFSFALIEGYNAVSTAWVVVLYSNQV